MNDRDRVGEILDRVIRVESKLTRLANGLNVNVRVDGKVTIRRDPTGRQYVHITSMDVSVSDVVRACKVLGLGGIIVDMYHHDRWVGTVAVD